ncbi:MAG: DUF4382 domain-containing protein [Agriterribacter sp.]
MKRSNVSGIIAIAFIFILVSCQKSGDSNYSGKTDLRIYLTDAPSFTFDAVYVEIVKMEIKIEDDSDHHESEHEFGDDNSSGRHGDGSDDDSNDDHGGGGWITLNINPGIYDLLSLRNGIDTLIASDNIASSSIQKIRITLGGSNSVVLNGEKHALAVKDQDNQVIIKLDDDMISANGSQLNLWLDFDASRSIELKDNIFELRSNIKAFTKNKAGSIEGRVSPIAAKAVVYAINGTDTTSALPTREGEFKIIGLKAGSYKLLVHPTATGYADKIISPVVVSKGEDAHVGTISL